jgi:hypothetical protein
MEDNLAKLDDADSATSSEIAATWNSSQENLLAAIGDRSNCLRWMHTRCQTYFSNYNFMLTVPSIAVSALAGSATIGLPALVPNVDSRQYVNVVMGLMILGTGVLTSINQYMKCAQLAEAHRAASLAYGKLHRIISCELSLRRDQRLLSSDFIKVVRAEQDRLQEISPDIITYVIEKFRKEFDAVAELEKPEIAGDLDHILVNRSQKDKHSMSMNVQQETPLGEREESASSSSTAPHSPPSKRATVMPLMVLSEKTPLKRAPPPPPIVPGLIQSLSRD